MLHSKKNIKLVTFTYICMVTCKTYIFLIKFTQLPLKFAGIHVFIGLMQVWFVIPLKFQKMCVNGR